MRVKSREKKVQERWGKQFNEKHVTRCLRVPILVLPYSTWFANSQICLNATGINDKGCLPHDAQNLFNVSLKDEEMDNETSSTHRPQMRPH